ncbi:hypothetical protein ACEWY4_006283 [Coilia grayii]|uniref:BED-type domain-containing protein n=1 Tax=Coilia grayii TaxID=363190 RepID=A0ABD1KD01_9TELE
MSQPSTSEEAGSQEDQPLVHPWPYLEEFFEIVGSKNNSFRMRCKLCQPKYHELMAFKNSPSNLKKHIQKKHPTHLQRYTELTSAAMKRKSSTEVSPAPLPKQAKLWEARRVSQASVDKAILKFIVEGLHPPHIVKQPRFIELVQHLQPNTNVMTRNTVVNKVMKASTDMKIKLKAALNEVEFIATTTDCWTAHRCGFIGVTAHWFNPQTMDRSCAALACKRLKGSHTFFALASTLNEIHTDFGIREKIVRTTTDNGSNFLKAFRIYGQSDENNNLEPVGEVDDDGQDVDEEDGSEDVEFVDAGALLDEDDYLEYQLPKHHRCACHLLNLVSTVDASKADVNPLLQLLSGPGSPLTTSGSDSEVSTSHLQTTIAMATPATLLRPQPLRITASNQWLRDNQQDRSCDEEGGAFSPEQLSPFSREGRLSSFSRVPSRVSAHSQPPSETQPHVCTCHSEAILALQSEVAHLRKELEERLSHLPHYSRQMAQLSQVPLAQAQAQASSRPKQEKRPRTRPRAQHRPSSSRGTKSNPGSLKVDDWISSDMDRSKSKDSRSSDISGSVQKSLSSTSGFLSPQRKSQISSPTGERQWSPELPFSSSTRDDSLRQAHYTSYLPPDEGEKEMYVKNRELTFSTQPFIKPLLQVNYTSSCSLPASFKVLEGQSSVTPYQRRRSTQSDSALLPSDGYFQRASVPSPRSRGPRTKHRTSKDEDISRTLDKAIEAARSMKRTTERMAQSLSADLAKAELQRKLNGLHPSEKRTSTEP